MKKNGKILILDDHSDMTDIVEDLILSRIEIDTLQVNNPLAALDLINSEKYSLIITDHHMPELSGLQLIEQIRSNEGLNQNCPIIILSAMESDILSKINGKYENIIFVNKVDSIHSIGQIVEQLIL